MDISFDCFYWILDNMQMKFGQILEQCLANIFKLFLKQWLKTANLFLWLFLVKSANLSIHCGRLVNQKGPRFRTNPLKHAEYFLKILLMTISISWPSFMTRQVMIQKIYPKLWPILCTNTVFESDRMVSDTINWTSQQKNVIFL